MRAKGRRRGTKSKRGTDEKQPGNSLLPTRTGQISKRAEPQGDESRRSTSHDGPQDIAGAVENLVDDPKLASARALHAQWIHEVAKVILKGEKLKVRQ